METFRFFFWEILKTLSLALIGLGCAKAIAGLRTSAEGQSQNVASDPDVAAGLHAHRAHATPAWVGLVLYGVVLLLVALGARAIGNDLAAEFYFIASRDNLNHSQPVRAYSNALRAVQLRPADLEYWQMLSATKFGLRQYRSLLEDQPALERLQGVPVAEQDAMRFAFGHFFLGEYDQTITVGSQLIQQNRLFAAPYVLLGMTYTAQKRYADAERTFLNVLQMYPSHEGAVEGLAHMYFLTGRPGRALAVLDQTARFPFDPDARKRFEQLKALYRQAQSESQPGGGKK